MWPRSRARKNLWQRSQSWRKRNVASVATATPTTSRRSLSSRKKLRPFKKRSPQKIANLSQNRSNCQIAFSNNLQRSTIFCYTHFVMGDITVQLTSNLTDMDSAALLPTWNLQHIYLLGENEPVQSHSDAITSKVLYFIEYSAPFFKDNYD